MLYHFCEEAGDTGIKFDQGSSRFFVVVLLSTDEPDQLRQRVASLREQLHLPLCFEFKFHYTVPRLKMAFFAAITPLPFSVRAIAIDKANLRQSPTRQSLYSLCLGQLAWRIPPDEITRSALVLDGAEESAKLQRGVRVHLSALAREGRRGSFKKVSLKDSAREDGLQCADMVCGAIYRKFARGDETYFRLIAGHIMTLLEI